MNKGIDAARGELIGILGDDDRWCPEKSNDRSKP
jgi:hypothetical protein